MKGCFSFTPKKPLEKSSKKVLSKNLLRHEDPIILASQTAFSVSEVEALYELYKNISSLVIDDGLINKEKFHLALFENKKKDNIFANRIFDLFDVKQKGTIDFGDFVRSLNVFHDKAPREDKISFSFKLYDIHGTGFIERQETFLEVDKDGDGRINQSDWHSFVNRNPALLKIMTLPYLKEITTSFPSFIFHSEVENV
uniref:calcineurin B-like protein 1 isoform X2 n=1 Tax=Erigeron canadensis TaxID=72917 RepID=UPI001CB8DABE|nr:calcineurin B-like protein 1 isoform X2 [Erigeron canadensis]